MSYFRPIAASAPRSLPGGLRVLMAALLAAAVGNFQDTSAAASDPVGSTHAEATRVNAQLLQPEWARPQPTGEQANHEAVGLQQPGFIYPAGEAPVTILPARHPERPPIEAPRKLKQVAESPATMARQSQTSPPRAQGSSLAQQLLGPTSPVAPASAPPSTGISSSAAANTSPVEQQDLAANATITKQATGLAEQLLMEQAGPSPDRVDSPRTVRTPADVPTTLPAQPASVAEVASHKSIPKRAPSQSRWAGLIEQFVPATGTTRPGEQQPAERRGAHSVARATAIEPAAIAPKAADAATPPPGSFAPPNVAALAGATEGGKGAISALWRPLAMNRDGILTPATGSAKDSTTASAPAAEPAPHQPTATNPVAQRAESPALDERLENSLLLRPFYLTEARPELPRKQNGSAAESGVENLVGDWERTLWANTLVRQLSLAADQELTAPAETPAGSSLLSDDVAWEQAVAVQLPAFPNPFTHTYDPSAPESATKAAGDTQLVAFLQDASPEPDDLNVNGDGDAAPAQGGAASEGANGDEADSLAEAEEIGEEPEDNTLEFLRASTVLLKPGESQVDVGIVYLYSENDFPILLADDLGNIIGVDEVSFRVRELAVPLEYRVGLLKRVQGFIGTSVGWSNTEMSLNTFEGFENDGGLGDINFGATMQLVDATANCPYWIATVQATAPTGGDPFSAAAGLAPSAPSLGQGFWSIAGNLLFIQPYDPVVVFYGLGTEHFFAREFRGIEIEPGAQYNYTFGVGFAVNERITLSGRFFGAYVEELKANGERLFNTNFEPMTMRFSATISKPCDRIVEPFVEFGLTDDSVSSFLGCIWTY